MKKEFIRDNGKIRNCDRNIAKMNVFSYYWFRITNGQFFTELKDVLTEMVVSLGKFLLATVITILYPIFALIKSIATLNRAKRNIKRED